MLNLLKICFRRCYLQRYLHTLLIVLNISQNKGTGSDGHEIYLGVIWDVQGVTERNVELNKPLPATAEIATTVASLNQAHLTLDICVGMIY